MGGVKPFAARTPMQRRVHSRTTLAKICAIHELVPRSRPSPTVRLNESLVLLRSRVVGGERKLVL